MNGKTKRMTHTTWQGIFGYGGRSEGRLGAHEILYEAPHVHILNKKNDNLSEEVMDVSDATAFLLRVMEGVLTPLWDGEATWSHAGAEGVADGFPTTGVVGVAIC